MSAPRAPAGVGRRYAWYALALLAVGNVLNYLDRNVIFALFEPLKAELDITDAQLGWLGAAFAIVFALGALPAGVIADLRSRRVVIAASVGLWSVFTGVGAAIRAYWQLVICRAAVGVGQAAYLPAGQAMLADYFPRAGRAEAMGLFWAGVPLGGVLALWLGGVLATAYGWRVTLVVLALPGVLIGLLVWRLREPRRERVEARRVVAAEVPARRLGPALRVAARGLAPFIVALVLGTLAFGTLALFEGAPPDLDAAVFGAIVAIGLAWTIGKWARVVLAQRHRRQPSAAAPANVWDEMLEGAETVLRTPTLIWMFAGGALTAAAMNGLVGWSASYLQRVLDLSLPEAGREIGLVGLLAGGLGSWAGGRLGDRLMERWPSGRVIASSTGFLVGAPLCVALLLVRDLALFTPLFFVVIFFFTWYNGPSAAVLFDVVRPAVAATVMGAYVFFIHIAGDAITLPLVGYLSDQFGLQAAMMILPAIGFAGGVLMLVAARTVARDMARVSSTAPRA